MVSINRSYARTITDYLIIILLLHNTTTHSFVTNVGKGEGTLLGRHDFKIKVAAIQQVSDPVINPAAGRLPAKVINR